MTGSKGSVDNALGNVMGLSFHDLYITIGILVIGSMSTSPVGGPLLHEGSHEIVHDDEFQVGLVSSSICLTTFSIISHVMDFVLGRMPVHQDSRVEVAALHPALLREHVKGAIVTEFQFYDVRKTAK